MVAVSRGQDEGTGEPRQGRGQGWVKARHTVSPSSPDEGVKVRAGQVGGAAAADGPRRGGRDEMENSSQTVPIQIIKNDQVASPAAVPATYQTRLKTNTLSRCSRTRPASSCGGRKRQGQGVDQANCKFKHSSNSKPLCHSVDMHYHAPAWRRQQHPQSGPSWR